MAPFTPSGLPQRKSLYSEGSDRVATPGRNSYTTGQSDIAPERPSPKSWTKVHKSSFPKGGIMRSSASSNTNGGTGNNYASKDTSSLYYTGGAAYQSGSRSNGPAKPQKRASEARIPMPAMISLGSMMADYEPGYSRGGMVGQPMGGMNRPAMGQPMNGFIADTGPNNIPPPGYQPERKPIYNRPNYQMSSPFMSGAGRWNSPASAPMPNRPMPPAPGANIPPPASSGMGYGQQPQYGSPQQPQMQGGQAMGQPPQGGWGRNGWGR